MIRSTDLSQLPAPMNTSDTGKIPTPPIAPSATTVGAMPPGFLNEPHRDMIMQKQRAANDFALPQSSTLIQDDDDDPAVHEAARSYASTGGGVPTRTHANTAVAPLPRRPQPQVEEDGEEEQAADVDDYEGAEYESEDGDGYGYGTAPSSPASRRTNGGGRGAARGHRKGQRPSTPPRMPPSARSAKTAIFAELRLAIIIASVYILVSFIPVENILANYAASLTNVSYVPLVIRAISVSILVLILKYASDRYFASGDVQNSDEGTAMIPAGQDDDYDEDYDLGY